MANCTIWTIDDSTNLVRLDDGRFAIEWAGATFGPADTLEELVTDELLTQCQAAILQTGERKEQSVCDIGPFGDSVTLYQ